MKAFKVFIFGLLYGWFVKFAVDRVYGDNEVAGLRSENASLKEYIRTLETRLLELQSQETKSVRRATKKTATSQAGTGRDDLKVIRGIGPAIEKKLNTAGIMTFEALARLSVEELENILGNTKRLVQNESDIIAQAQRLTQQGNLD